MKSGFDRFSRSKNALLAFDPGYQSLRSASRGTLSVVLSFFLLSALARHWHQPPTLAFLGVLIALMASLVVNDTTTEQQKKTFLLLPLPACLGLITSICLSSMPQLRLVVFLCFTFFAVYLRRFGTRWLGLGFIAFFGYFAPLFFPIQIETAPWVVGTVVIVTGISYVVRFWLIPNRPRPLLKLYLKAFELRLNSVLKSLSKGLDAVALANESSRSSTLETNRELVRRSVIRLNELILTIEQFLEVHDSHSLKSDSELLQMALFERELSVRQLLDSTLALVTAENVPSAVLSEAAMVLQPFPINNARLEAFKNQVKASPREIQSAVTHFCDSLAQMMKEAAHPFATDVSMANVIEQVEQEKTGSPPSAAVKSNRLDSSTRQAIQVTLATALASLIGLMISHDRWYWASITAFVVFAGATRGDTLMRAFWRIVGTTAGLIFGFLMAYLLSGHHGFEWGFVILCIFLGIFGARMIFGFWTAAVFSLMLAVLYDILGMLNLNILVLRLEETIVGALAGAIVSAFVFPTSTRKSFQTAMAKLFRSMSEVVQLLPLPSAPSNSKKTLVRQLRSMDRDLLAIRTTASPIVGKISLMKQGGIPGALYDVSVLAHYIRHLATFKGSMDSLSQEKIRSNCLHLTQEISQRAVQFESGETNQTKKAFQFEKSSDSKLTHLFERIEQVLLNLDQRKIE
jgi:uncharacterized membrane protein YccC